VNLSDSSDSPDGWPFQTFDAALPGRMPKKSIAALNQSVYI
jgi:hypothetical protein